MEPLNSIPAIQAILRKGIEAGHWTLEDLDTPSYGFREMTRVDRATFKGGYEGVQHRNLLRNDQPITHPEVVTPKQPQTERQAPDSAIPV